MVEKKETKLTEGKSFQLIITCDEEEEIELYMQSPRMYSSLWDISRELRKLYKYGIPEHIKTHEDMLEHIDAFFWNTLGEREIDL